MKILYAEDEPALQHVVKEYLKYQGFDVTAVNNGEEAVKMAETDAYDAVVLDVMMPVMDGISAIRKMREAGNMIPAVFLTAKSDLEDCIEGLDAGADDYLTKPFAMAELSARLRALCRRRREYKVHHMTYGNIELDTEQSELKAHNTISLAFKEVRLLSLLIARAGETISAREILDDVWQNENAGTETVWMYVSFLRGKLESVDADAMIEGDCEQGFCLKRNI